MKLINPNKSFGDFIKNAIPILLGFISFFIVCGVRVLNPKNEQWLLGGGDATQHYLGWVFFRNSPWAWPPGLNPTYGVDLNNSIVFTDSIPLLAIPFKALSPILSDTFQYFGWWALVCFILQSWFAWKLVNLITSNLILSITCTTLFIFSVPMLSLFPENPALASLFLILAALYLSLKNIDKYDFWPWFVLLISASLIHFYIFVLVGTIWVASIFNGVLISKKYPVIQALQWVIATVLSVLIACYLAGYFTISSAGAFGYGVFKINLLGVFNPAGWSILAKEIYVKPHWWAEEPIYFGIGGLVLVCITLFIIVKNWGLFRLIMQVTKRHLYLILAMFLLTLFSISHNIAVGPHEFTFPISEKIIAIASILRSSGRMFIPVYYLILLLCCYVVVNSLSKKRAAIILALCAALQITDLSKGWIDVRQRMTSKGPFPYSELPLINPYWNEVSKKYKDIIYIPSRFNLQPDFMSRFLAKEWRIFGRFASLNQMGTNAVMLARYDEPKFLDLNQKNIYSLNHGTLAKSNLYIIDKDEINTAACTSLRSKSDLFAMIDGFYVYAPDYFNNQDRKGQFDQVKPMSTSGASDSAPFSLCGTWSKPEGWGTWSDGSLAKIYVPITNSQSKVINLTMQAYVNGKHPTQQIEYTIDGKNFKSLSINQFAGNQVDIPISHEAHRDGFVLIEMKLLNPVSPKSLGLGDDSRELGVGVTKVEIR